MEDIVVGIDIGTSKVCAAIGRVDKNGKLTLLGVGVDSMNGVKKGIIVDIDSVAKSIRSAVNQAEETSNLKIGSAYVNIMGTHVSVIDNRFSMNVSADNREITSKDVDKILSMARSVSIPEDRQIIDIIPRQYIIDGYDEILEPVGMVGVKLEVDVDVVIGKITSVQNMVKSMERAGISVDGLVVEALSTGGFVLTPEEKELSVLLIDVGAGITDVSVFKNKKMVFCDSIPVGGDHITNDISIGLKISYSDAEKVKREYGLALTSLIKNDQEFTVTDNEGRKKNTKVSTVVEIIEARVYEIFSLVAEMIEKEGVPGISEVVITGGGIMNSDGSADIAQEVFNTSVRVASCRLLGVSKYEHITAAGMVKYISGSRKGIIASDVRHIKPKSSKRESGFFKKLSKLFNNLF
ncbi:MAG TPA: cell division protein FtsA [Clostridia bacterium]